VFTRNKKPDVAVNLTPLIDVVFLLLIFFMVSTSFTRETQIKLDLPKADVEKMQNEPELIEVSIDKEGRYYVNGKALINSKLDTLKKAISGLRSEEKDIPLIISADANTPYQAVVTAMDAASQLGITNLKMATQRPQNSE
jgi:biopolymer transport protein ExbD